MTATESVIELGATKALTRLVGGQASAAMARHNACSIAFYRDIRAGERDLAIQNALDRLRHELDEFTKLGERLLEEIPEDAEPPSEAEPLPAGKKKDAEDEDQDDEFNAGCAEISSAVSQYSSAVNDLIARTEVELRKIEEALDDTDAGWPAMRQISNAARNQEIQLMRFQDMPRLTRLCGRMTEVTEEYVPFGGMWIDPTLKR